MIRAARQHSSNSVVLCIIRAMLWPFIYNSLLIYCKYLTRIPLIISYFRIGSNKFSALSEWKQNQSNSGEPKGVSALICCRSRLIINTDLHFLPVFFRDVEEQRSVDSPKYLINIVSIDKFYKKTAISPQASFSDRLSGGS